jgi:serine/threonine protein kinase
MPKHKNIVEYHHYQKTENYFYLILEFCKGGDLQRKLDDEDVFSEKTAQLFFS